MRRFDVVVIGGGIAGVHFAEKASEIGLDVCIIENNKLGGNYLFNHEVPFNVLTSSASCFTDIKTAKSLGFISKKDFDFTLLQKKISDVVSDVGDSFSLEKLNKKGIKVLFGSPKFINRKALELKSEKIFAKKFVIATGSKPLIQSIEGLDTSKYLLPKDIFILKKLPKSICIIGGGMTGVELAFSLARFGCQVALLEQTGRIVPEFDKDVSQYVKEVLEKNSVKIFTDVLIKRISYHSKRNVVEAICLKKKIIIKCDNLFVATGRIPRLDNLNLEATGIKFSEEGIKVNKRCRTNKFNIFACGDVTGVMKGNYAIHQADIVLSNICFNPKKVCFSSIPDVLHIDPEVSILGKQEDSIDFRKSTSTIKVNLSEINSSKYQNTKGFLKLILSRSKLVGVVLAVKNSSSIINNYRFVLDKNIDLLKKLSFPKLSISQMNEIALEKFHKNKKSLGKTLMKFLGKI